MDKEIGKIDIHRSSPDKGFTLVELLIVFVILAIIAAIVVPVTFSIIDSSHDSDSKTMAKNIMNAVQTTFQTFVDTMKKEGKWNEETAKEAKERAFKMIQSQLTEELKKYINENFGDIKEYIMNQIESMIYQLKR